MPGRNEREMARLERFVRDGCVGLAKDAMRLIHGGTIRPYGQSPGTPVVTGQHRSGGRTALGSPPTFVPPDDAPVYPIWGDDDVDASFAGAQLGDEFFWANRAPAPALLEQGRSQQAPTGFLGHSIEAAKAEIESTRVR